MKNLLHLLSPVFKIYNTIFQLRLFRWSLFVLILCYAPLAHAQTKDVGPPLSQAQENLRPVQFVTMPDFNMARVVAEDIINDANKEGPWRFGYEHKVNLDLQSKAQMQELPGKGRLYRLGLSSQGAISINLVFTNYKVPKDATLHLYAHKGEAMVGAYTSLNNHPSGMLGTDLVAGDHIVVEYFEPYDAEFTGKLHIGTVVHGYRSPGIKAREMLEEIQKPLNGSGDCNVDVDCPTGNGWEKQIRSVGLLFTGGGTCSGALINNTSNNGAPYFLTALHCGLNTGAWVVRFNWESTVAVCATTDPSIDPGPPYDETLNGATALASNSGSDFSLARLDNLTPLLMQNWNLYFSGWDRSDTAPTSSTGIHHPKGDVKKISQDFDPATKNTITFQGDSNAMMWRVADWDVGVTEPGSSGSPLFDQNKRIIGQLCCGAAACNGTDDNDAFDHYGRFGVSWDNGSSSSSRLKDWLDPNGGTTPLVIDGLDPLTLIPDQDLCSEAVAISCEETITGTALNATDQGAPGACDVPTGAGVWFTFTGIGEVTVIKTEGSDFDTRINIYTGSCGNLSCVVGDDDSGSGNSSKVEFCSDLGITYYIYLSGQPAPEGGYSLTVNCPPAAADPYLIAEFPSGETNMNLCFDEIPEGPTESEIAALYEDACGDVFVSKSGSPTGDDCNWSVTYSYTAEDENGNSAPTETITYSGGDTEIPSVLCPGIIHLSECEAVANWTVTTSDKCGDITVVSDPPSGSTFPKGSTTTVNVTATDECGNINNCSFIVERDPDLNVDIDSLATSSLNTCAYSTGANIVIGYGGGSNCVTLNATATGGHSPYTFSWEAPNAVPDTSFSDSNTATPTFCADFQSDPCVTYTFKVTVTDAHGCQETGEIEVNVVNASIFANGDDCAKPNNPKVVVCHHPPGNGQLPESLCVNPNAVPHHLGDANEAGHGGDCLGACEATCIYLEPSSPVESSVVKSTNKNEVNLLSYKMAVFPNPFNLRAKMEISANQDTRAQLAVFDLSGIKVADLYNGTLEAGVSYYFDFDPEHLSPGIYIAQLIGPNGISVMEKLVYLK